MIPRTHMKSKKRVPADHPRIQTAANSPPHPIAVALATFESLSAMIHLPLHKHTIGGKSGQLWGGGPFIRAVKRPESPGLTPRAYPVGWAATFITRISNDLLDRSQIGRAHV